MVFVDGYPDITFVGELDNRRPFFINGPIDNSRDLALELPEPISAENLDVLHVLKGDAGNCSCIDDCAESNTFESIPRSTPSITQDNSDIDNFLREYNEFSKSYSNSLKNLNSSDEHNVLAYANHSRFSAAPASPSGITTSNNHIEAVFRDAGPFPAPENPNIRWPASNDANMSSIVYGPQPGHIRTMQVTKKKQISVSKVLCNPSIHPKSQIACTHKKANMTHHLDASPVGAKRVYRHKVGKSNPVHRKWAVEAKAAPSVSLGELLLKSSNPDIEVASSSESDITRTRSSSSLESSSASDSSPPDTPRGPPSDLMPQYASVMHNGPATPKGFLLQKVPMPQNVLPPRNGSVPLYGPPMRSAPMPQYDPPMHSAPMPWYGPPMHNALIQHCGSPMHSAAMPQYGPPMQNGTMLHNNMKMHYGPMSAHGPLFENGIMPVYNPLAENPVMSTDGGFFVNATNAYIFNPTNGIKAYIPNGSDPNKTAPNGNPPMGNPAER